MIKAEVVADSVSPQLKRLTTLKVRYPWFIHGEVMTHRVLSRNASSNRAIPLKKMLEEARSDDLRAEPVYWGKEQKGMEPGGELDDIEPFLTDGINHTTLRQRAKDEWREAARAAAKQAELLGAIGLHKSLCNRLLMPFTHANVVITATEWGNFFGLRLDRAADPTMRALAIAMWEAMTASEPKLLQPGQWHLPFVDYDCETEIGEQEQQQMMNVALSPSGDGDGLALAIKVSVARCARVSYESFPTVLPDGTVVPGKRSTVGEDLQLYDRLLGAQPMHASPAEHQATPDTQSRHISERHGVSMDIPDEWDHETEHGNFVGWRQYRKMLPGEASAPMPEAFR